VDALAKRIEAFGYVTEVSTDEEHSLFKLIYREGSQTPRTIGYELLSSAEYHRLVALHESIGEMDQPPCVATTESGSTKLGSRQELVSHLMELGKKDLTVRRYKGLGEMNPDQLWQTTMDQFFPGGGWLRLQRETLDRLQAFRGRQALVTWDEAIDLLLQTAVSRQTV